MPADGTSRVAPRLNRQQRAWVEHFAPRVATIAAVIHAQVGTIELEDFVSAGNEALVRVSLRYDPALGIPFEAFAYVRVRGAMIDAVRTANPEPRRMRRAARALAMGQLVASDAQEQERRFTTGLDPRSFDERFEQALQQIRQTTVAVIIANTDPRHLERLAGAEPSADDTLAREESATQVRALLSTLTCQERELIDHLYFRELTMQELADEQRVNKSTISRRHTRLLAKLATRLEKMNTVAAPLDKQVAAPTPPDDPSAGDQTPAVARPRGPPSSQRR